MVLALCTAHPLVDAFCEALVHCIASHHQVGEVDGRIVVVSGCVYEGGCVNA